MVYEFGFELSLRPLEFNHGLLYWESLWKSLFLSTVFSFIRNFPESLSASGSSSVVYLLGEIETVAEIYETYSELPITAKMQW